MAEHERIISLHGLGFAQVRLGGNQRLHVWHPGLPRRRCAQHSSVHDHRFGFVSQVLVGSLRNEVYEHSVEYDGEYMAYLHEGPRLPSGNRAWERDFTVRLRLSLRLVYNAGDAYRMEPYVYHESTPMGDGRVATLMRKTEEHEAGAHSLAPKGVEVDEGFDRFQLKDSELWAVVQDVLGGHPV